jgi:hypothetical protein
MYSKLEIQRRGPSSLLLLLDNELVLRGRLRLGYTMLKDDKYGKSYVDDVSNGFFRNISGRSTLVALVYTRVVY